jgi:hypothetical protein
MPESIEAEFSYDTIFIIAEAVYNAVEQFSKLEGLEAVKAEKPLSLYHAYVLRTLS